MFHTDDIYMDLAWLPRSPENFGDRCRDLLNGTDVDSSVRSLASCSLSESQLAQLSRAIRLLPQGSLPQFKRVKLAVISNSTTDFIVPAIEATGLRYGMAVSCIAAGLGQVVQEVIDPRSAIYRAKSDVILVAVDYRIFGWDTVANEEKSARADIDNAIAQIKLIKNSVQKYSEAVCIFQTLSRPPETVFGNLDRAVSGSLTARCNRFNEALVEFSQSSNSLTLDVAALSETVGLGRWHDASYWNVERVAFSNDFVPFYADHVCRLIAASLGKSRRALILDLDNTLWGGVIGDDGIEGIRLAEGDPVGQGYREVQRMALALRSRGVVLAVSSKNTHEIAIDVFSSHPEMILRKEHFAAFRANWDDKVVNIKAIALELSLGLDSFVFLDDNPVERELVRQKLPEVAVPELPDDPALFARILSAAGYFEASRYSYEDSRRADFYGANARRVSIANEHGNIDDFLISLEMSADIRRFDAAGRARVTQLINKSNQWNLTTRRYNENQVQLMESDNNILTMQVRLSDKFGDNGMVSVMICRPYECNLIIDSWLMSCRVLGRRLEHAVLNAIMHYCQTQKIEKLFGYYVSTEKNSLVENHYSTLGFNEETVSIKCTNSWVLHTKDFEPRSVPIHVKNQI